jgi:hypothetical protein
MLVTHLVVLTGSGYIQNEIIASESDKVRKYLKDCHKQNGRLSITLQNIYQEHINKLSHRLFFGQGQEQGGFF